MPNPICRLILTNGLPCGYVSQGETRKEQIADLHRHGDGHLDEMDPAGAEARRANREQHAARKAQ